MASSATGTPPSPATLQPRPSPLQGLAACHPPGSCQNENEQHSVPNAAAGQRSLRTLAPARIPSPVSLVAPPAGLHTVPPFPVLPPPPPPPPSRVDEDQLLLKVLVLVHAPVPFACFWAAHA
mmetsp:Transcript_7869/g.15131  ORF Transcript_7869/g.15131 Transcript_7869/m.15131 type:complete len:122 (+) Transcript_7869:1033-1398(+)